MFRITALALLLSAGVALAGEGDHAADDDHVSEAGEVRVLHAWTTASSNGEARVYLRIENNGADEVTFAGADAGSAGAVTLVGLNYAGGGAEPEPLGAFPIPAGTELDLAPDGLFLLVSGLEKPLAAGDHFDMHIELEPVGEVEIHVEVHPAGTTEHPHAGHSH